jgi:AraC-like DNA-binding protein
VGEIAYQLEFELQQSFSKLFKSKINVTPSEFRQLLIEKSEGVQNPQTLDYQTDSQAFGVKKGEILRG